MRWGLSVALIWCLACSVEDPSLVLELKTDYAPGVDFFRVEVNTVISDSDGNGIPWRVTRHDVAAEDDYTDGVLVANLRVPVGNVVVDLALVRPGGMVIAERRVVIDVADDVTATVLITSDCADVVCPSVSGIPQTCIANRCVDARCTAETPDACGGDLCTTDAMCATGSACAVARCVDGFCLVESHDDACPAGTRCSVTDGCIPLPRGECRLDVDCGDVAHATASCVFGQCQLACDDGFADCDTAPGNGCEADLGTNLHCGACFATCPAVAPGATVACIEGQCALLCEPLMEDCNGEYEDGCEVQLNTQANCSACGDRCTPLIMVCSAGHCRHSP